MNSLSPDAGLDADSLSTDGFGFIMQLTHSYKQIHEWACSSSVCPDFKHLLCQVSIPIEFPTQRTLTSLHTLK